MANVDGLTASGGLEFCVLQYLKLGPGWFGKEPVGKGAEQLQDEQANCLQGGRHGYHSLTSLLQWCTFIRIQL